jgi:O-antigen ligase
VNIISSIAEEIRGVIADLPAQESFVFCLACFLILFLGLEWCWQPSYIHKKQTRGACTAQASLVILLLLHYTFAHRPAPHDSAIPILFVAMLLGKNGSIWVRWPRHKLAIHRRMVWLLSILSGLVASMSLWHTDMPRTFLYRGVRRWSGPWDSPNEYGLLMGIGLMLAVGLGASKWNMQNRKESVWPRKRNVLRHTSDSFLWIIAALCGIGLFKSYSRGAWLATSIGLGFLIVVILSEYEALSSSKLRYENVSAAFSWFRRNWQPLFVIFLSVIVLTFWNFRFVEWRPIRRAFSIANVDDFSWRNRLTAWRASSSMIAAHPWIGFGWAEAESAYEQVYCPPQSNSGAAILTNDFLMLGVSAGAPPLICFLLCIWLSLKSKTQNRKLKIEVESCKVQSSKASPLLRFSSSNLLRETCRAGAISLLVGFCLDGGLFKLATSSVFWVLLEMGQIEVFDRDQPTDFEIGSTRFFQSAISRPRFDGTEPVLRHESERLLRWLALTAALAASAETVTCVGAPFCSVNSTTLNLAQRRLVSPEAVADLNYLATNSSWSGVELRVLLQHACLANYNRDLINWKLDEQIYRKFVLSPDIVITRSSDHAQVSADVSSHPDGAEGARLSICSPWHRRPFWEHFYPPIRHEIEPQAAAAIVLKYLTQHLVIVENGPITIDEMWQQQQADLKGFQALKVAACRSVGVPARLNEEGQAELFSNDGWQIVPP